MIIYKATLASCGASNADIKRAAKQIEVIPGVKVIEADLSHFLIQFDADPKHLQNNPILQRQFDIMRGDVRAEIEKLGGITVKECLAIRLSLFKKIWLRFSHLFQ